VSHIFDLKGSLRSRYATLTGNETDVLLDQNLLEFICENPLWGRCRWPPPEGRRGGGRGGAHAACCCQTFSLAVYSLRFWACWHPHLAPRTP